MGSVLSAELVARPSAWLSAFVEVQRKEHFEALAHQLEDALSILFGDGQMKALFAVWSTLDELAADCARHPEWRVARARQLRRMFVAPKFLASLAEQALSQDVPPREITELVLRIGGPAANALYSARLKTSDVEPVRRRFVHLVRELGVAALPMIRAGLARLESKRDVALVPALVADLFAACPRVRDEEAGELAGRYLEGSPSFVVAAAAQALVALWGARATPDLLGLLSSADGAVSAAAVDGLRELRVIDDDLRAILRTQPPSG
jgi:hypothetical protein